MTVETTRISLASLSIPKPKVENIRTVESSLRLDSVASAGFRMSRAKMADIVKSGDVRYEPSLIFREPALPAFRMLWWILHSIPMSTYLAAVCS